MGWIAFVGKAEKLIAKRDFKAAAQRLRRAAELMGDHPQRWMIERWAEEAACRKEDNANERRDQRQLIGACD